MIEELRGLLAPILAPDVKRPIATEATTLPDVAVLLRPQESRLEGLRRESLEWVRTVLKARWVAEDPRLWAAPRGVDGHDAFVGAWRRQGRILQAVVTHERVHVLTRLPAESGDRLRGALSAVAELLAVDPGAPEDWTVEEIGGLLLAGREGEPRNWDRSLFLLTDGRGVKFSFAKLRNRSGRVKRGCAFPEPHPWFEPE